MNRVFCWTHCVTSGVPWQEPIRRNIRFMQAFSIRRDTETAQFRVGRAISNEI